LKTVIVGAGALGSVLGGHFALAGADVTLLARKAHAEAIQKQGLRMGGLRGEQVIRNLRAVSDAAELTAADFLILSVKSYDTHETLASLGHLRSRVGAAISVQNGGGQDEALAAALGPGAVVGATTIIPASMPEPGRVLHGGDGGTWIGELDGRRSDRVEAIVTLFRTAGLRIEIVPDIRSAVWAKLNQMVPAATLSYLTRLPLYQVYLNPTLAEFFVVLSREIARVAERVGITLRDFQGFPVKTLCSQPFADAVESVIARGRAMQERGMTEVKISTLQDLERGRRTEAAQVIGYVAELARTHGVPMPTLDLMYRVIQGNEAVRQAISAGTSVT
jgi:2-dehydropantoate 2-reductase